jgi:aminoglycoside 3-N-acetyltransferase
MEAVTDEGLLMMTTHSYNFTNRKDIGVYKRDVTPAQTGIIPETFRQMEGVLRSLHPTHSVAAWGKDAQKYIAGHEKHEALGEGTPFYRFARTGGKILMIGCDLEACTLVHEAEWEAQVPYLDIKYDPEWGREAFYYDDKGEIIKVYYKNIPGCSHGFVKCQPELIDAGCLIKISLNKEISYLANSGCLMNYLLNGLSEDPYLLLNSDSADCYQCTKAFKRRHNH